MDADAVENVLAAGRVPLGAGGFELAGGQDAIGGIQIEVDRGPADAVEIDRDAAEHRRIHAIAQRAGDGEDAGVVTGHADPQLVPRLAEFDRGGCGHEKEFSLPSPGFTIR